MFRVSLHSPNDIADVREWYKKGIEVATGHITTIRISSKQLTTDNTVREIDVEKRGCRFHDENEDLSVFEWYSKANCLLDCSMNLSQKEFVDVDHGITHFVKPYQVATQKVHQGFVISMVALALITYFRIILQDNVKGNLFQIATK